MLVGKASANIGPAVQQGVDYSNKLVSSVLNSIKPCIAPFPKTSDSTSSMTEATSSLDLEHVQPSQSKDSVLGQLKENATEFLSHPIKSTGDGLHALEKGARGTTQTVQTGVHEAGHAIKELLKGHNKASKILLEKAKSKNIEMPKLPLNRKVDPSKKVTLVFHGSGEKQEVGHQKNMLTSLLVEDAAQDTDNTVIVIDGISSRSSSRDMEDVQKELQGAVVHLPSTVTKIAGPSVQLASGNGMFENATAVMKALAKLDPLPGNVKIVGYSRGSVTASIATAMLDHMSHGLSSRHRKGLHVDLVCMDPVPGPLKDKKELYSRDILKDIAIPTSVTIIKAGLDPAKGILEPQRGSSGRHEHVMVMPTDHIGVNGYKRDQKLNPDVQTVTQFILHTKVGIKGGKHKPEARKALQANLDILNARKILAQNTFFKPRPEAKQLLQDPTSLWLDSAIQDAFMSIFPEVAEEFALLGDSTDVEKSVATPAAALEFAEEAIAFITNPADKKMAEGYLELVKNMYGK